MLQKVDLKIRLLFIWVIIVLVFWCMQFVPYFDVEVYNENTGKTELRSYKLNKIFTPYTKGNVKSTNTLFRLYTKHQISYIFAFLFSLAIGFNPNLLLYSSRLLPQQFLGVLIAIFGSPILAIGVSKSPPGDWLE